MIIKMLLEMDEYHRRKMELFRQKEKEKRTGKKPDSRFANIKKSDNPLTGKFVKSEEDDEDQGHDPWGPGGRYDRPFEAVMTFKEYLIEENTINENYTRADWETILKQLQDKADSQGRIVDGRVMKKIRDIKKMLANWDEEEEETNISDIRARAKQESKLKFAGVRKQNKEAAIKARAAERRAGERDPRGDAAEERMQNQMMHGTEEEEAYMPAQREINKKTRSNLARGHKEYTNAAMPSSNRKSQRLRRERSKWFGDKDYKASVGNEEEEAKMPANRDRDMEFQGTMDRLNKPTQKDDLASTPGNKRLKQRYNRYKRKTWGGRT